jgi:hypothetical protein
MENEVVRARVEKSILEGISNNAKVEQDVILLQFAPGSVHVNASFHANDKKTAVQGLQGDFESSLTVAVKRIAGIEAVSDGVISIGNLQVKSTIDGSLPDKPTPQTNWRSKSRKRRRDDDDDDDDDLLPIILGAAGVGLLVCCVGATFFVVGKRRGKGPAPANNVAGATAAAAQNDGDAVAGDTFVVGRPVQGETGAVSGAVAPPAGAGKGDPTEPSKG